ncbi:hypothetical protein [Streptomyces sp. NBC_01408]|uniref:hypothetical protein n=1 Tax=Streptomyces sp. NBC_01408 TaxID=2903855 RepID=UPI00225146F1|nr:hypothetical protein [Streptomyces sp. NBC_01408]MCX4695672.1 hypothetical protein [Streptomyces sp. NBC_01408]
MAEPTFTRAGDTPLYWADPADRVAAFLASDPGALGNRPTLTRTWEDGRGAYVFLGAPAPDSAGFLAALRTWLTHYAPQGPPRFLWVADPTAPPTAWGTTALTGRADPAGTWVADGSTFLLADYRIALAGGGAVAPADTEAGWGFAVADGADGADWSAVTLYSPTARFPARRTTTLLCMDAGHTGAWRFVIDAPAGSGDAFGGLGAGLRFFTPGDEGVVKTVRFGVVRQPEDVGLEFHTQIDPLRPLDGERTSLGFFACTTGEGDPPALPSGYATVLGHGVDLRPLTAAASTAGPARLVFGVAPYFSDEESNTGYYLVPDGPFAVEASTAGPRVICGMSGLEYLGLPAEGCTLAFLPGQPAYAPLGPDRTGAASLTPHGTTSWVSVESAEATGVVTYYSQPEDAPLYTAGEAAAAGGVDLLEFCEVPAATATRTPFPMAPFHGLADDAVPAAVTVEQLAIAPTRRAVLLPGKGSEPAADAQQTVAVTPQGLAVGLAPDFSWSWLGIGHDGDAAAKPDLRFTTVTGPFRQAMQTNNLFLVLGDPEEFNRFGSVAYELTTATLDVIATIPVDHCGVPSDVLDAVRDAMHDTEYDTRTAFVAALVEACPEITDEEQRVFLRYGGRLTPVAGGWPFRLSPDSWRPSTYLIVKFALGRSIAELVADVSTWAWPSAASRTGRPADAQEAIRGVIDAARNEPSGSPYASFLKVVDDPNWTGVLALSAEVPLDQLPDELQVLAAGIDPAGFGAHHFGLSLTPFRLADGQLVFERSAMFGLIDYQNPEDQYFSENIHFAFRVLQLTVGVRNSVVTTFTSKAELLVNRLFGAPARLFPTTHGNNIILDGALQRQQLPPPDGTVHDTYVFSMAEQNTFQLDGPVLQSVELLSTQLVTAKASDPASGRATVGAVFRMAGNLRFYEPEKFDPFCWGEDAAGKDGYLRFGGLAIAMSFDLGDPAGTTRFTLKDGNLSFDAANSRPRAQSMAARFPIGLNGLIGTPDPELATGAPPPPQTPADMGYVSVTAPLDQSELAQPWYGLDYTVDLGSLGALAGSKALAIQVLVAWSPGTGDTDPGLYLGVRLPGAKGLVGVNLPLQGVVTMGFRSVEFLVSEEASEPRTYTLRLRDFAVRLLGLAFPPGHNDVILFGNPDQGGASKVGWYLAYASAADPKRPPPPPVRAALRSGRGG